MVTSTDLFLKCIESKVKAELLLSSIRSMIPKEFIPPDSLGPSFLDYSFVCRLKNPVIVDDQHIIGLSVSYPPDIDGLIETLLVGPDGSVHPSDIGYEDIRRHYSTDELLVHLRDLAQKLSSYA